MDQWNHKWFMKNKRLVPSGKREKTWKTLKTQKTPESRKDQKNQ